MHGTSHNREATLGGSGEGCNGITLFGKWFIIIGLFVRLAVFPLMCHSGLIAFCEPAFLLLRHLKHLVHSQLLHNFENLKFSRTLLDI